MKEEATIESEHSPGPSPWLQAASVSYLGIFFGVSILLSAGLGSYLDARWGTKPYLLMVGVVLGVASGFKELWRIAKRYRKQLERKS